MQKVQENPRKIKNFQEIKENKKKNQENSIQVHENPKKIIIHKTQRNLQKISKNKKNKIKNPIIPKNTRTSQKMTFRENPRKSKNI